MTTKFEYYKNEGNVVSSAGVTRETESKILAFNPEGKLRAMQKKRGMMSLAASELKPAA